MKENKSSRRRVGRLELWPHMRHQELRSSELFIFGQVRECKAGTFLRQLLSTGPRRVFIQTHTKNPPVFEGNADAIGPCTGKAVVVFKSHRSSPVELRLLCGAFAFQGNKATLEKEKKRRLADTIKRILQLSS